MLGLLMLVEVESEKKRPSTDYVNQGRRGKFPTPFQMDGMLWPNRERLVGYVNVWLNKDHVRYHLFLGGKYGPLKWQKSAPHERREWDLRKWQ